jgi:protein-tyrosine phosphatase
MFTKIYWIQNNPYGTPLGIMARPRGNDALEDEIRNLKMNGVRVLVCLLEAAEIYELGLRNEQSLCDKYGIEYLHLPIQDRGVPASLHAVKKIVKYLQEKLRNQESVVIHCRMGIGRSSIIAGAILLDSCRMAGDVLDFITRSRGLTVPDTEEQVHWLKHFGGS